MSNFRFTPIWLSALQHVIHTGQHAAPRSKPTLELLQNTLIVDMRYPVLLVPERKLNYQFMAAEAYWILTGDYRVSTIAPYNKYITQFSDDGVVFYGAYGPKVMGQLNYVVNKLLSDRDTRQAGLTIWRENPSETKDVPCTVAMFFNIRYGRLNCHTFMRSNDIWLGTPYDVFNFSMISHLICARYNEKRSQLQEGLSPGDLHLTAASLHLYTENREAADQVLSQPCSEHVSKTATPTYMHQESERLVKTLKELRDTKPGDPLRWWE